MKWVYTACCFGIMACNEPPAGKLVPVTETQPIKIDSAAQISGRPAADSFKSELPMINTGATDPDSLVAFAKTLIGIPYAYGSADPAVGFDCSGFITYIFNHFHIAVPRSSVDFTGVGQTISVTEAKKGDLILFTGTKPEELGVGHMGLVIANDANGLSFIHATSGKAMSVAITPLNDQYKKRFVRISRVFVRQVKG